jgi:peroxin-16
LANALPHKIHAPTMSVSSSLVEDDSSQSYTLPPTGLTPPSLSSVNSPLFSLNDGITARLFPRVRTIEDIKPAARLLPQLKDLSWYAEALYILQPLLYALIMQQWVLKRGEGNARRSWWPWLLGLSIEYMALELRKRAENNGYRPGLSKLEKDEQRQRSKSMWWWLLRGAMYQHVSKYSFSWMKLM